MKRDYRQDFADFSPLTYLNCAYQGAFPKVTAERVHQAVDLKAQPYRLNAPEYFGLPDRVRAGIARLVGAHPDEIAIATSATQGIGIVAAGLALGPGDEVVVRESNFPSNLFTWINLRRKGVTVKVVRSASDASSFDDVAAALTPRTRVLALDWVSYSTGFRIDLAALGSLIHDRGGIFVVDGTQGVGANELNLHALPVDVMAVAAYKWVLGPYGTGFAYVSRNLLKKLDLPVINWHSVVGAHEFDSLPKEEFRLIPEARVFDSGETGNFINLHGLERSIEYVTEVTPATVNAHCRQLLRRLDEGLRGRGYIVSDAALPGHESTILCFRAATPAATAELHRKLTANNISVSLRHGFIRVSPYLYNDEADIDRLLELVRPA